MAPVADDIELDLMIEAASVQSQLETGIAPAVVAARSHFGVRGVRVLSGKSTSEKVSSKSPDWLKEEDEFLKQYLGLLAEEDIADVLGRTICAVHLRWKRDLLRARVPGEFARACRQR